MARANLDNPFMTLSGQMKKSDNFYFATRNGKTFVCAKGVRTKPLSQKEIAAQQRFHRAVDWANMVQRNDELFVHYMNMWKESSVKCPTFRGWLIKYYYHHFPLITNN